MKFLNITKCINFNYLFFNNCVTHIYTVRDYCAMLGNVIADVKSVSIINRRQGED